MLSSNIVEVFKEENRKDFEKAEKKLLKFYQDFERLLYDLNEVCNDLQNVSEEELSKGMEALSKSRIKGHGQAVKMVSILSKEVSNSISKLEVPTDHKPSILKSLADEIGAVYSHVIPICAHYIPRIKPHFYFKLRKLAGDLDKLSKMQIKALKLLENDLLVLKEIEEIENKTKELDGLDEEIETFSPRISNIENQIAETESEINKLKEELESISKEEILAELKQLETEEKQLKTFVFQKLSKLKKTLKKLLNEAKGGSIAVPRHIVAIAESYLADPVTAFSNEEQDFPKLQSLLSTIDELISTKRLKLDDKLLSKTKNLIQNLPKNKKLIKANTIFLALIKRKEKIKEEKRYTELFEKREKTEKAIIETEETLNALNERLKVEKEREKEANLKILKIKKELEAKLYEKGIKIDIN